jgi:pyruvate/2-oxoacid:ferredoxin oxidoreductase beta subunit
MFYGQYSIDTQNPSPYTPTVLIALAITMGALFVARVFAGGRDHLKALIK